VLKVISDTPNQWVAIGLTRASERQKPTKDRLQPPSVERPVGRLIAQYRPNQRWYLLLRDAEPDAVGALIDAAVQALQQDLLIEVNESDTETLNTLAARGFSVSRREHLYLVPTDWPRSEAAGFDIISAVDADPVRWCELDDALRRDVPGSMGWHNDPTNFAADTLRDPQFDPATYLIAVDQATGDYAGLVRVWQRPVGPRLGMIATMPAYRRRGVARALLSQSFDVLHRAGHTEASCEVDATNVASNTLLTGLGARRDGGNVELERRVAGPQ
jgi:ribosomal protein S18 acetylase RimI-like enzyme